jgi:LacI family transcriptional regulator
LNIARLPDETLVNEGFVPKILREWTSDGLLINVQDIPPQTIELLREYEIPSVWINSKAEADCVHPDDLQAGEIATEHLLKLGHRRIVYLAYDSSHYSVVDRRRGYEKAMQRVGLQSLSVSISSHPDHRSECIAACAQLLTDSSMPTAVICHASYNALLLLHIATRQGLQVPDDLSIITFGEYAEHVCGPHIATVILPLYEMGRNAVQMLCEKIAEPALQLTPRALPVEVVEGETCAPPR